MPTPEPIWTLGGLAESAAELFRKRGFENARLEADLLLGEALGLERIQLYTKFDMPVDSERRGSFRALVKRRLGFEPLAYILGRRDFLDSTFEVGPGVLIPRPETEELVLWADEYLNGRQSLGDAESPSSSAPLRFLELGVGSGCILISLLLRHPSARGLGIDIEASALTIADRNGQLLEVSDRARWLRGDLFAPLGEASVSTADDDGSANEGFDIIVSNPPYIERHEAAELMPDVRDFEPRAALFSPQDSLFFHRAILDGAAAYLRPQGAVFLELGAEGGAALEEHAARQGIWGSYGVKKDLSGRERMFAATREDFSAEFARHFVPRSASKE
ncbi:MAG: peptide chain release factor N(5)-glutamine methyltransferase [Planctomycetota bacterium]